MRLGVLDTRSERCKKFVRFLSSETQQSGWIVLGAKRSWPFFWNFQN